MPPLRVFTAVSCDLCGKKISRKCDLPRHMRTHATNREEIMFPCPYSGCTYKTLQRYNLQTHLNIHTGERPKKCPTCPFRCGDPATLTRHRKEHHGYVPKLNSRGQSTSNTRKAAPGHLSVSPHSINGSPAISGGSTTTSAVAPLDPTSNVPCTPRPKSLPLPDVCSPPCLSSPGEDLIKDDVKNNFAGFSSPLINYYLNIVGSLSAPNNERKSLPIFHGMMAPRAPMVAPQVPEPENRDVYGVDFPTQSAPGIANGMADESFDNLLAQLDGPKPCPSIPSSMNQYSVNNAYVPSLAPSVCGYDYSVGETPVSSVPRYGGGYDYNAIVAYNANNSTHAPYSYPAGDMSFDPRLSQLYSFGAPGMGFHPQVVDQTCMYTAPVGASSFPMQWPNVY